MELPLSLQHIKIKEEELPRLRDLTRGWHSINYWMTSDQDDVTKENVEKLICFELATECRISIIRRLIMKLNAIKRELFLAEIDDWLMKRG